MLVYRSFVGNSPIVKYHHMTICIWAKDKLKAAFL